MYQWVFGLFHEDCQIYISLKKNGKSISRSILFLTLFMTIHELFYIIIYSMMKVDSYQVDTGQIWPEGFRNRPVPYREAFLCWPRDNDHLPTVLPGSVGGCGGLCPLWIILFVWNGRGYSDLTVVENAHAVDWHFIFALIGFKGLLLCIVILTSARYLINALHALDWTDMVHLVYISIWSITIPPDSMTSQGSN